MTPAELAEWNAAIEVFQSNNGPVNEEGTITDCSCVRRHISSDQTKSM
jgi:hypothetical protein